MVRTICDEKYSDFDPANDALLIIGKATEFLNQESEMNMCLAGDVVVYPLTTSITQTVMDRVRDHYAEVNMQVTFEDGALNFKHFGVHELYEEVKKLESGIDCVLDDSGFDCNHKVRIPFSLDIPSLVLNKTLDKYRKADHYVCVTKEYFPESKDVYVTFELNKTKFDNDHKPL
ncbi:hypothetical protein GQ473_02630 [archaeon]|nr:hypothetical protein [archaeon]